MNTPFSDPEIAHNYADKVRTLFTPSGVPTRERGGHSPSSPQDLAKQANDLSPISAQLTQTLAAQLTNPDPNIRCNTSIKLLAKALTDLEISAYLYQAAVDEEEGIPWPESDSTERSITDLPSIEDNLQVILNPGEVSVPIMERGTTEPTDIPTARINLSETVTDTLDNILDKASKVADSALSRVIGLNIGQLTEAIGVMGMDIAEILGQGETASNLYNAVRNYFSNAYDTVIELMGQQLSQALGEQAVEWLNQIKDGASLSSILEKLYVTQETSEELNHLITNSQGELGQFITAITGVSKLEPAYSQQIRWVEKTLNAVKWFGTVAVAVIPQGEIAIASFCVLLASYVILLGGDYVDSPKMNHIDRVAGVRRIVETNL